MDKLWAALSDKLQYASNVQEYCSLLYQNLSALNYDNLQTVYKIGFSMREIVYQNKIGDMKYWELNIHSAVKLNHRISKAEHDAQRYFLGKINFDKNLHYSILNYDERRSKKENDRMIEARDIESLTAKRRFKNNDNTFTNDQHVEDIHRNNYNKAPNNNNVNIKHTSDVANCIVNRNAQAGDQTLKKTFVKKFNPGGDPSKRTAIAQKWINIINKYYEKSNMDKRMFFENHIEELGSQFDPGLFFCKKLSTSNNHDHNIEFNNNKVDEVEPKALAQGHNSSYHSSSTFSSTHEHESLLKKINVNYERTANYMSMVSKIFIVILLLWTAIALFLQISVLNDDLLKISPYHNIEINTLSELFSTLILTQLFVIHRNFDRRTLIGISDKHESNAGFTDAYLKSYQNELQAENKSHKNIASHNIAFKLGLNDPNEMSKRELSLLNILLDDLNDKLKTFNMVNNKKRSATQNFISIKLNEIKRYRTRNNIFEQTTKSYLLELFLQLREEKLFDIDQVLDSRLELNKFHIAEFILELEREIYNWYERINSNNKRNISVATYTG